MFNPLYDPTLREAAKHFTLATIKTHLDAPPTCDIKELPPSEHFRNNSLTPPLLQPVLAVEPRVTQDFE